MKLSKSIIKKMNKIRDLRREANALENEVYEWFESRGFNTFYDNFIDTISDKLSYGEFDTEEELQGFFEEFQEELKKERGK